MILIHLCPACGHNDLEPRSRPKGERLTAAELARSGCILCNCPDRAAGPPETAPSFTWWGQPIERLAPPGTRLDGALTTCACEHCKAEYERQTS